MSKEVKNVSPLRFFVQVQKNDWKTRQEKTYFPVRVCLFLSHSDNFVNIERMNVDDTEGLIYLKKIPHKFICNWFVTFADLCVVFFFCQSLYAYYGRKRLSGALIKYI